MFGCLSIPLLLAALIGSFWWDWEPWAILAVPALFVLIMLGGFVQIKTHRRSNLSPDANDFLQRHAGYFLAAAVSRDISSMSSIVQLAAVGVSIIQAFRYSWWILGIGVVVYAVFALIASKMNPTHFIKNEYKQTYDEVWSCIESEREEQRLLLEGNQVAKSEVATRESSQGSG